MGDYRSWSDEYPWRKTRPTPGRIPPSKAQQFEWFLKHKYGNARVSDDDRKTWLELIDGETPPPTITAD